MAGQALFATLPVRLPNPPGKVPWEGWDGRGRDKMKLSIA
jgi:hypothetical protein